MAIEQPCIHSRYSKNKCKHHFGRTNVKISTHEFTYQLARALCLPSVQHRFDSSNGIRVNQMMKIKRVLSINKEVRSIENKELTGWSYVCAENIIGTPSYISKRNKLNNKLEVTCHSCNQILCKDHYDYILCHNCKNEQTLFQDTAYYLFNSTDINIT